MSRVVCVVPTHRPDNTTDDLIRDLASIAPVLVTDDASPCTFDQHFAVLDATSRVRVIRHRNNMGIGRGLNEGLAFAREVGAQWLLTVDQDSRLPHGYVDQLAGLADDLVARGVRVGALGALRVADASGEFTYPTQTSPDELQPYPETEELIASGTLWNVDALADVGGFEVGLGMDAVDAAACLSLREVGYRVIAVPDVTFEHRIGNGQRSRILGRSVLRTGHSRRRRNQILVNRLRLFPREWRQSPVHAVRTVRRAGVNAILGGSPGSTT